MHEFDAMQYCCEGFSELDPVAVRLCPSPPLPRYLAVCYLARRVALLQRSDVARLCAVAVVGGGISTEPRIQVDLIEGLQLFNTTYPGVTTIPGPHSFTPALSLSGEPVSQSVSLPGEPVSQSVSLPVCQLSQSVR